MPLIKSKSKEAFSKNISTEIKAGKPPKQAAAIAYSVKRAAQKMKEGGRPGLWENIHAKQERIKHGSGEHMRKPGSPGAPTAADFKSAAKGTKMAKGGEPRLSVSRGEKLPTSQGAGLTAKGREKFNRATGANLKAPAPHPKTKADAGRKKSFCARMSGMPGPKRDEKGNLTRKAASLKRWNCPGW
jgi:hypothetical protein